MLDLLELVAGVGAAVVVGDVAGVEVEPDVGMIHVVHQGQHRGGVLGGPLVRLEGQGDALRGRRVAQPAEVCHDRLAARGSSSGWPAPVTQTLTPNHRAAKRIRRSVSSTPSTVRRSAPPTLQPLIDTSCLCRWSTNDRAGLVIGPLGDHRGLGDDQAAEVVPAEGQLEMVDPRFAGSARRPSRRPRRRSCW